MMKRVSLAAALTVMLACGGSGAALAWPLLVSACAILNEMASFESAGVSDKA